MDNGGTEGFERGSVTKALARRVVIIVDDISDVSFCEGSDICGARQVAPEPADGVFDSAFLPGTVRITKEG